MKLPLRLGKECVWGVLLGALVLAGLGSGGTVLAATAPKLSSSAPANNATDVAVTSKTVTFVFDTEMLPNPALDGIPGVFVGALKWSANLTDSFEYGWSEDGKTLTCTYSSDFPAQSTITWALNPPDAFDQLLLQSAAGTPLPKGTYSGSFKTGAAGGGGGGGGGGVPVLVSVTPANGATAIPVTSTVKFVFDQAMVPNPQVGGVPPFVKGAIAWTGAGLTASKFTYSWSADSKTLTCTYTGSLPGTTTIGWELNPADALFTLDSAAGDPLPSGQYSGSFTTGAGGTDPVDCTADEFPSDWGTYALNKGAGYTQTSPADPVPSSTNPFSAGSFLNSGQGGIQVTAASLTFPGGKVTAHEGLFGTYFIGEDYPTEAAQDAAFPAGPYTLKFTRTGEAERAVNMTVPANTIPVPKIANYAEAQAVQQDQAFTLRWNAFTGGAAPNDGINLSIMEGAKVVFQAPDPCVPRELAVTATSIVIPAGTFTLGKTYQGTLSFGRQFHFSTNAIPKMAGFGSIGRTTEFTVVATGGVTKPDPARFVAYVLSGAGRPQLTITGSPNRAYTIERAGNLTSPVWRSAGVVTLDATGRGTLEDTGAGSLFPLFYRAVAN